MTRLTVATTGFRRIYGAPPTHLLIMVVAFTAVTYVLSVIGVSALWAGSTWSHTIIVWFIGAVILHDLVLFPLYSLTDRALTGVLNAAQGRMPHRPPRVSPRNYIRLPALAAALLFALFFPGILRQGAQTFSAATGLTQEPYAQRFAILVAALFAISAILYLAATVHAHRGPGVSTRPSSVTEGQR